MCFLRAVAKNPGTTSRDPGSSHLSKSTPQRVTAEGRLGEKGHQAETWNSWVWVLCLLLPLGSWASHIASRPLIPNVILTFL